MSDDTSRRPLFGVRRAIMSPSWTVILMCLLVATESLRGDDPLQARGVFVPARSAAVTAANSGRVVEVMVREGRLVKKGENLFRVDTELAEVGLRQAEARVRLAEARVKLIEVLREEE